MAHTTKQAENPACMFKRQFELLTGKPPLRWQERLFHDDFGNNKLPPVIDLPTGLGKTMVMAIWLIARSINSKLPRRLIYVVDRRTVVDQATDLALLLKCKAPEVLPSANLTISTLRGQLADNREWTRDPSGLAIIIGTVDLIGSGLLFSGYRSSYKRRPLEAGFLGQDSLLVLDEAHLSKPFAKLICAISHDGRFQKGPDTSAHGAPMRVIRMSATSGKTTTDKAFRLNTDPQSQSFDLYSRIENGIETNPIKQRFEARKRVTVKTSTDVIDSIATEAGGIAAEKPGSRIVIFVKSPKDVDAVRKALIKKDKSRETQIAQLTGTMRGLERDELVDLETPLRESQHERRVMQRFLIPGNYPSQGEGFLISTSAGEVGFDLNADHLVGDAAPIDSWIQRLGRVNRRGTGEATVILIKETKPADKTYFDKACIATSNLLIDEMDVSPKGLAAFKESLTAEQIDEASTPEPVMVELTDILLDAWSMTSITERMPGRPEVAPWLRGIADDLPQTTIAWRAELDVPTFDQLDLEDIKDWYDTHAIRAHELLSVPTNVAAKWVVDRWDHLTDAQKLVVGPRSIVIDRAGLKLVTVKDLIQQLARKNTDNIRNADMIVPASYGGIERGVGLLDPSAPQKLAKETDADEEARKENASADVADERGRYRELVSRSEEGVSETRSISSGTKPENASRLVLELESSDDTRVKLISYVPRRDKPEWGSKRQTLREHVGLVRRRLDEILCRLDLPEPLKRAGELAADYHDHGKNRERWQRTVNGATSPPGKNWSDQTIGKSGGEMKRDARHYRHEFGSLRDFIDAHRSVAFTGLNGADSTHEVIDLALHLIATHHGRGRPHFPKGGFDPDAEARSPEIHNDIVRRFARLQRKFGWWRLAWLENLLRCADALASTDEGAEAAAYDSNYEAGGTK